MVGIEKSLAIYLGSDQIATLSLTNDKLQWGYNQEWRQNGFPLSPHLSLDNEIPSENVERFLRNLFPEGEGLNVLVRSFQLSKYNTFGLIRALGRDISGALIVLPSDVLLQNEPIFRPITKVELEERLLHREQSSLLIWDAKPRLSSAGVQDKINVLINAQGELGFGEGSLCSTHILKFEKQSLSHLILNEFITMQLAKHCGLDVANIKLKRYGKYPALLVTRFDRKYINSLTIKRRHIIDGCQALNLPPEYKYERIFGSGRDVSHIRDGASYRKLFQFAETCSNPSLAKLKMLDWSLFNALIFNSDAHGKNISFFIDNNGINLAPFYDLVNIKMYPEFEQEMAMAFGDEFEVENIGAYQLADFSDSCLLDRGLVAKSLQVMTTKILSLFEQGYKPEMIGEDENEYFDQYRSLVIERCQYLQKQAKLIKSVKI